MKTKFFLFVSLVLLAVQGWATDVNPASMQFSTDVGQTATQTISIEFADAETPSDPNTPVVMSSSSGNPLPSNGLIRIYSADIQGDNSHMFSAQIIYQSVTSDVCTVKVSYNPTDEGTHHATLIVNCSSEGVPSVSVDLTGNTISASDDPFTNLPTGLGSVTKGNGTGLPEGFIHPGFNPDNIMVSPWSIILGVVPILRFKEVAESDSFFGVTVGSSATKTYEIRGHNFGILSEILNVLGISMKIRLSVSCTNFTPGAGGDALFVAGMFSVDPEFIDPWEIDLDEGGEMKRINLTYKPTTAGLHPYKIVASYYFFDANGFPVQDYFTWFPIIQVSGIILKNASAVERHFTATANGPQTFNDLTVGDKKTCSIHVEGTNLDGPLSVDLSPKNGMFSIDKESITADDAANGADITVTYEPTAAGSHDANLKISGGGTLETTEFDFTGNCQLPPPPTITVDQTPLNFGTVYLGDDPKTKTITVKGTNLASDLNLSISGASDSMFTALPNRISPTDAAAGRPVVVTYKPTAVGNHTATLVITGGGANPVEISLNGKCLPVLEQSIAVDPSTYDFGTADMGEEKTKEFTVIGNNLNAPISIDMDLETNGGEYTFAPTSLPPSGGTVTVTFKPVYNGSSGAAFTLTSGQASAHFAVTGTCVIPPHISPSTTSLDFGTVDKGKEKTKTFNVAGTSLTGNLTLTTNSSYYTVSPATITPAEARTNPTVTVTYKPTAGGNHDAILSISGGGADSKTINLSGKCVAIDVTPSTYDFGTVNQSEEKTKEFTVIGTNLTAPISIDMDLETNGGEYTFSPTSLPPSGGTVTVKFKPIYNGSSGAAFTLTSGQASAHFAVTGTCVKPNISVNPTSLAFGNVVKGNNPTKTFKVTGTDLTGNLSVSSSNSTYFTVSPTTITAAQAKVGATVTVTYKASATGSHSGTITISGGGASPKTVRVSGKCVVPAISVSPTSIAFGTVVKNQLVDKSFWVTGSYLTGSLTVSSDNSNFIVSPTSISAAEAAEGKMVTVTYKPTAVGSHSGTITISGGGASPKTVSVSGKCVVPEISVSTTSLLFGGNYDSRTFRVTGTNLTGSLALTSNNNIFTVTPSTITASQAANGVTVTVQCNAATNIQRASGKITISGGGASPKYVNLTLDVSNVQPNAPMVEPEGESDGYYEDYTNGGSQGAFENTTDVYELEMNSKIYADRLNIIIESPVQQKALISDIAGHVREVDLQTGRNEVPVNSSGIYFVRIREKSTKLMLK